jgi:RNA polymerase sigma-32 factor
MKNIQKEERTSVYKKFSEKPVDFLSAEQEEYYLQLWSKEKNEAALSYLIKAHFPLILSSAKQWQRYTLDKEDLVAAGVEGLMKAISKFDAKRDTRLSTYASKWIVYAMRSFILESQSLVSSSVLKRASFFKMMYLRAKYDTQQLTPELISEELDLSLQKAHQLLMEFSQEISLETLEEENKSLFQEIVTDLSSTQEALVLEEERVMQHQGLFEKTLNTLSQRDRLIVMRRLFQDPPDTLRILSEEIGLSQERIRQIEKSCLQKLKKYFKNAYPMNGLPQP